MKDEAMPSRSESFSAKAERDTGYRIQDTGYRITTSLPVWPFRPVTSGSLGRGTYKSCSPNQLTLRQRWRKSQLYFSAIMFYKSCTHAVKQCLQGVKDSALRRRGRKSML